MKPDVKTMVFDALNILNYEHGKVSVALTKLEEALNVDDKVEAENNLLIAKYTLEGLQITAEKITNYVLETQIVEPELKLTD